ncbi:unnamed protein product [Kuraishia capsulata CBS 1993]|uniref:SAM domain-containing protein n=1 Tax=Kuraishia capsulata CBS 1993 TaxID=1382522 RepID=W6MJM6_9ASCO|nr:uncharacterized protein KUCA_T00002458001 [Kuraishia capsulata CBS 1993]CDK26486.1 unnamed protein product [Kuraishia capsulata CBS 1993]
MNTLGYEKSHPGMARPSSILIPTEGPTALSPPYLSPQIRQSPSTEPLDWDANEVSIWISSKEHLSEYATLFAEHNVTGLVLPMLESDHLREMGITSLKDRIRIKHEISILLTNSAKRGELNPTMFSNSFTELQSLMISSNVVQQLSRSVHQNARSGSNRDPDYRRTMEQFNRLREEMLPIFKLIKDTKPLPTPENTTFVSQSPSAAASPTRLQRSTASPAEQYAKRTSVRKSMQFSPTAHTSPRSPSIPSRSTSLDPSYDIQTQLRANTEDSCLKVLQAAMRRHKLNADDWKKYALVICYGDQERVLDYHEKPVVVVKELGELGKSAAIMLRQVEDADQVDDDEDLLISVTPGGRL